MKEDMTLFEAIIGTYLFDNLDNNQTEIKNDNISDYDLEIFLLNI